MTVEESHAQTPRYTQLRADALRLDLAAAAPIEAPLSIYVEPTNVCNLKCSFCPESFPDYEEKTGGPSSLDLEAFGRVCDQILSLGRLRTLNLYMLGEPFANRRLPEFIALAKARGVADRIVVTSNGTLLNEAMAERVIASGLDYLRISVYGTDQESFTRITTSRIPFDRIHTQVRRLKELRDAQGLSNPYIYVKMIDSGDAATNERFIALFAPVCDQVAIEPVMNWDDPAEGSLSGRSRDELLATPFFGRRKEVCPFPFYSLVVHSDLTVSVCCVDWAKRTIVGNLRTETLEQVWRGDALRRFRMMHLERRRHENPACSSCTFLHTAPDNLDALSPDEFARREGAAVA